MASLSSLPFTERAKKHPNPLARRLFEIAERKKSNITLSADLESTKELLHIADILGPYIVVLKTHIDFISDFSKETIDGLVALSQKHDFLLFEDRKFVDIGNTAQIQYARGDRRIHDWAHIVNACVLAGEGTVQAIDQTMQQSQEPRAILILAEMTSKGSMAVGDYTRASVTVAQKYSQSVIGFVSTRELSSFSSKSEPAKEDFVIFTTGVNISSQGDALGQQYQTPTTAMQGGSDFLIVGRGIYAAADPVAAVTEYQKAGWQAYLTRTSG